MRHDVSCWFTFEIEYGHILLFKFYIFALKIVSTLLYQFAVMRQKHAGKIKCKFFVKIQHDNKTWNLEDHMNREKLKILSNRTKKTKAVKGK